MIDVMKRVMLGAIGLLMVAVIVFAEASTTETAEDRVERRSQTHGVAPLRGDELCLPQVIPRR